jgi:gliding motility-associated-like protein
MLMLTFILALVRAAALSAALIATAAGPRLQGFSFQSVTNRMITPNGDQKNDTFVVNFSNPAFSEVTGTVYDIRGHWVADMTALSSTQLQWDGRSDGNTVPTGVYLYVIRSEGISFRGAVVVVR